MADMCDSTAAENSWGWVTYYGITKIPVRSECQGCSHNIVISFPWVFMFCLQAAFHMNTCKNWQNEEQLTLDSTGMDPGRGILAGMEQKYYFSFERFWATMVWAKCAYIREHSCAVPECWSWYWRCCGRLGTFQKVSAGKYETSA